MKLRRCWLVVAVVAGCAGDPKASSVDATSFCTGLPYDSCRDEHNCLSANCRPFGTLTVCSASCTGNECPMQNGNQVPCMGGFCQPPMANSCLLAP